MLQTFTASAAALDPAFVLAFVALSCTALGVAIGGALRRKLGLRAG